MYPKDPNCGGGGGGRQRTQYTSPTARNFKSGIFQLWFEKNKVILHK